MIAIEDWLFANAFWIAIAALVCTLFAWFHLDQKEFTKQLLGVFITVSSIFLGIHVGFEKQRHDERRAYEQLKQTAIRGSDRILKKLSLLYYQGDVDFIVSRMSSTSSVPKGRDSEIVYLLNRSPLGKLGSIDDILNNPHFTEASGEDRAFRIARSATSIDLYAELVNSRIAMGRLWETDTSGVQSVQGAAQQFYYYTDNIRELFEELCWVQATLRTDPADKSAATIVECGSIPDPTASAD